MILVNRKMSYLIIRNEFWTIPILIISETSLVRVVELRFRLKDEKLFLVCSIVIIVVIISAFGYGWIVREEVRTGGMGEKWRVSTSDSYQPELNTIAADGSLFFIDNEHHLFSLVDGNGVAEWSHDFGSGLVYYLQVGDEVYLIAVSENGNYTLDCLDMNGIWISSTPCPPVYGFIHGDDGGIYGLSYETGNFSIYNIQGGSIKWTFTQNGSLGICKVWNDGKVLLRHINYNSDYSINSSRTGFDVDEAIMLSPMGIPLWNHQFPTEHGFSGSSYAYVADNGTIVLTYEYNGVIQYYGCSIAGEVLWTENRSIEQSPNAAAYFGCQSLGGDSQHEFIESVFRSDPANHSYFWNVLLNDTWGGSVYEVGGVVMFVSNDGQVYGFDVNGTILWQIHTTVYDTPQCLVDNVQGLLLRSDNLVTKIGKDGTYWTYDGLDSSVRDLRFGPNNTIYVLMNNQMVVLDKPVVSTPTEYMIAMLSVDMLIALSSGLWITDRIMKKPY